MNPAIYILLFKNPQWDYTSKHFSENDLAVLKLTSKAIFGSTIQVACLPTTYSLTFPALDSSVVVLGWGTMKGGQTPKMLQEGQSDIVSCSDSNDLLYFCSFGSQYTCFGDSGGPVFQMGSIGGKSKYVLAGLTSALLHANRLYIYAHFNRFGQFIDFILYSTVTHLELI